MYQLNLHDEYLIFHWLLSQICKLSTISIAEDKTRLKKTVNNFSLFSDLRLGFAWSGSCLHLHFRPRNIPRVSKGQQNEYHHQNIIYFLLKEEDTGQPPPYPEAVLVMDIVGNRFN